MIAKKGIFLIWAILIILTTFICLLVYIVTQQSLRLVANEEPMELAVKTSINLESGQSADIAIPAEKANLKSLSTFVMVYDNNKNLLAASVIGEPSYPVSVLDYVKQNGESRVTWQPASGLRYASVAIKYDNGYIVAARSLSETERLIDITGKLILSAWLAFVIFTAFVILCIYIYLNKKNNAVK
jgi:hypothetical protein